MSKRRRTIGLLLPWVETNDTFATKIVKTSLELARQKDCNLIFFLGRPIDTEEPDEISHTALYRLISPQMVSGAIVSHPILARLAPERQRSFLEEFSSVPMVTESFKVANIPCVFVDNEVGLREMMKHLIQVHGCKRIAHIRGPQWNNEAQLREDIWREELTLAGLPHSPDLVVQGHFRHEYLGNVTKDLMEQTGGDFDAVFACNDNVAFTVAEDLQKMGKKVPEDYLVCGYDDLGRCQYFSPPITTVRQPLEEQTRLAWDFLEGQLENGEVPEDRTLGTRLVVRASCSCDEGGWSEDAFERPPNLVGRLMDVYSQMDRNTFSFHQSLYDLNRFVRSLNYVNDVEDLPFVLAEGLPQIGITYFAFLCTCDRDGDRRGFESRKYENKVLPSVPPYFSVLATLPEIPANRGQVLAFSEIANLSWFAAIEPFTLEAYPLVLGNNWYGLLLLQIKPDERLLARTVQEQLISVMERLYRVKGYIEQNAEERAKTLLAEERVKTVGTFISGIVHEINSPLGAMLSSNNNIRDASTDLVSKTLDFFAGLAPEGKILFRNLIAGSLKGPDFKTKRDRSLKKTAVEFLLKAGASQPEKTAEDLAEISFESTEDSLRHLVQTPGYEEIIGEAKRLISVRHSTDIIEKAGEEMTKFMSSLSGNSEWNTSEKPTAVDVAESVENSLELFRNFTQHHVVVVKFFDRVPPVLCRPRALEQVWENLFSNAVHAMAYRGRLEIRVRSQDSSIVVSVADDGHGIPEAMRPRIFTPFFTTKPPGEGIGLGLEVSKRIVESVGGSISFESRPGRTVFEVRLRASQDS